MSASNLHVAWVRLFLRAAASAGVTEVVLSPGSRSTPLAIAAASTPGLRLTVIVDERSAAFFALGQARVTGRPSLLVCTSGTAGAHYFPAIIEAHESFVPLLAVTADRPWELQGAAAPQTIDQRKLFGDFVRAHLELGVPDAAALRAVPRIAAHAVAASLGPLPGPVHVNAPFRKPLEPVAVGEREPWEAAWEQLMERGAPRVHHGSVAPDEAAIAELASRCARAERGVIVCGPMPLSAAKGRGAILDLARATGFPLLAEATSNVRFGGDAHGAIRCSSFDAILEAGFFRDRRAPDLVIEMGAPATSAGWAKVAAGLDPAARFVIAPHGWNDPSSGASAMIFADPGDLARALNPRLRPRARSAWAEDLARADRIASALASSAASGERLSEASIARAFVASCPEGALLAVGNSTPVRDLDAYCPASSRSIGVLHQRGASGIDGLVSGAAGAHLVASGPVGLILGDVSVLHDLGALGLLTSSGARPLVVVVVQNGGGRIFDRLPIAASPGMEDVFDRCFATPQRLDLAHAAAAFGVPFARVTTKGALDEALAAAWSRPGATLVEAVSPPREGAARVARLVADLRSELAKADFQEGTRP